MTLGNPTRRGVIGGTLALFAGAARAETAGEAIRPLVLVSNPQANDPTQYQAAQLAMQEWRKLGLKVTLEVLPATQQSTVVWMTTAARALTGVMTGNARVTGGAITFAGRDLLALDKAEMREVRWKEIAFIP